MQDCAQLDLTVWLFGAWGAASRRCRPSQMASLPDRLKQSDAGSDRDVDAAHVPLHRNRGKRIASLADKSPQARAFGPEDDRGGNREIDSIVRHPSLAGESDRPDAEILQLLE